MSTTPATASDLFGPADSPQPEAQAGPRPLADRLRPRTLEEVVGQDHLLGADGTLTRMLARGSLAGWERYERFGSPEVGLAFGPGNGLPRDRAEMRRAGHGLRCGASARAGDRQRIRTTQRAS